MRKRIKAALFLSMIIFSVILALVLYWTILPFSGGNILIHSIMMGLIFGVFNSVIFLIYVNKYSRIDIKNKKLNKEIRKDKLTELLNRNAFNCDIIQLSPNGVYSMIFMDIDNFREFNNVYGHQIGDNILKVCANGIKNNIRHTDSAYRFGGDEIIIILPECEKREAGKIAQNIVQSIRDYDNAPYPSITVSAGVASMPEDALSFDQLIKVSDLAMVKAKNIGKNQVIVYDKDI